MSLTDIRLLAGVGEVFGPIADSLLLEDRLMDILLAEEPGVPQALSLLPAVDSLLNDTGRLWEEETLIMDTRFFFFGVVVPLRLVEVMDFLEADFFIASFLGDT